MVPVDVKHHVYLLLVTCIYIRLGFVTRVLSAVKMVHYRLCHILLDPCPLTVRDLRARRTLPFVVFMEENQSLRAVTALGQSFMTV